MIKWIHHLFNPHCSECFEQREREREESKVCESCETLKIQLAIVNQEKSQLLARLLDETSPKVETVTGPPQITRPIAIPWKVRQQMLEREDRIKAKLMKDAPKPIEVPTLEELEADLGIIHNEMKENAGTKETVS